MNLRGKLFKNKSLAEFTSWRVGGNAKCVYHPADLDDLSLFLSLLPKQEAVICLGAGTNVLVPDNGIAKTVIILKNILNDIQYDESSGLILAGAGTLSSKLSTFSIDLEFRGLEFLAGIPGTIGGALAMNAGAYGSEIWNYVTKVETINCAGEKFVREKKDFEFGYRKVKNLISNEEWFIAAYFNLERGNKEISLQIMQDWLTKRKNSQPLDLPNAGSVFKNPKEAKAARLIELCGLKGHRIGGASVSTKHANFIVNDKNATATDIENLIEFVAEKVKQQTGIELAREVRILE
ncbi:MAG: UDP-N-acetylmuramate dehydrogenase [Gammaproteobacteria bacterium]|jgi:UDP-N-acetylmuramate dehydrogenase